MCGRYVTPSSSEIELHWDIKLNGSIFFKINYNTVPSATVPIILKVFIKIRWKKYDKNKKIKPTINNRYDFPCMVSKDNSIKSISNMLCISPPRFPATDKKAKMLIIRPKRALSLIIFLQ